MNSEEVVLLLKKNPRIINGHAIELPKFATGTRLLLNFSGTYPSHAVLHARIHALLRQVLLLM